MEREELIRSKEYWLINIQNKVFNLLRSYKENKKLNQTQLASKMGVTKGYVSQILNGDYDHKVSKLVDLSLACNKVPILSFIEIDKYIENDKIGIDNSLDVVQSNHYHFWVTNNYQPISVLTLKESVGQELLQKLASIKENNTVQQELPSFDFQYSNYSRTEWQKK